MLSPEESPYEMPNEQEMNLSEDKQFQTCRYTCNMDDITCNVNANIVTCNLNVVTFKI